MSNSHPTALMHKASLLQYGLRFGIYALLSLICHGACLAISIGDRVQCITNGTNVRSGAGTGFSAIPGSPINSGARGVVMNGPYSGSGFTWYLIRWDGFSQDGYTATITYNAVVPDKPVTSAPGGNPSPGLVINTVTPTFQWGPVKGGVHINIYIRDTASLALQNFIDVASVGGTWTPPAGALLFGHNYKWNMQASDSVGDSPISNDLYFQVVAPTGTIRLTVNGATGSSLPVSEMNSVVLFYVSTGASIALQPTSNPIDFLFEEYASYRFDVYCWDMLAAQVPSFAHNSSLTSKTATTLSKRPLSVVALRSDGNTYLSGATVVLESYNGQNGAWTERARGTTNELGTYSLNVWPTTIRPAEKYRARVIYGGVEVGSDLDVWVPDTTGGRTLGITTTVAAPTPTAQTLAATSVTATSAQMNATVNPNGTSTTAYFEFGPTTSYGGTTSSFNCGNGTAAINVLNNSSWASNTTFHYRIVATNSGGTSRGDDVSFTTLPAPTGPIVTVTDPTSGSSFQVGTPVNITWTLTGVTTQVNYFKVAILDNGVENASLNFFAGLGSSSFSWTPQSSFVRSNLTARVRALDANGNILAAAISPSFSTTSSGSLVARATAPEKVYLNSPATFSSAGSTPVPGRPITSYAWEFYVGSTQVGTANVAAPTFTFSWGKLGSARVTVGDGFTTSTKTVEFALLGTGNPTNTDSGSSVDPVNTATGNFVMSPTLLEVHARALPFVFQAYYNSKAFQPGDTTPGPLGYGWTHTFETRISEPAYQDGVLSVIITFGDGHPETYRFENAVWTADSGNYNKLARADNGIFTLITPNQIKHQFDANGRLASIIDRNGNTLSVVWTATPSRITSVILPGGPDINGNPRKIDFTYDAAGHLSKLTDPINRTVEFTVDAAHNLTAIKNPRGYSSLYTYDLDLHQMLTGTDPRTNRFVRNVYQDRVVTEQYDVDDHKTTFEYPFTAGSTIDFTRITREAAGGDEITEDHHNAKLQLLERKVWLTATTSLSTKAEYYDNGDRKAVIDRNNNRTSFEYTDGDVTKVTFADTSSISMTYSPYHDLLTKTNQLGIVEKREYDDPAKGNLVAITFPFDAADTTKYKRTFTVDAFGQTTAATDANNRTTRAYFNEWGENWKVEDAETPTNSKTFDFDGIGRKTGVTDERGNHTTFTLNENGGAVVSTLPALPAPIGVTQINQTFDENDNLTSIEDPLHRFTHTEFDQQDRPYKVKNHNLDTITTEFDELGRAVRVQDPKLHYSHRVYDLASRLTEARDQMGRKHVFTYDANGNVLTDIDDDGVKVETVWDEMNRPIKQRRYTSPTTYDETITHYNLLGQIDWTEDAASHVNHNRTYFYYNDAGQLIRLVEPAINGIAQEFTWTYDFEGNLLSATHPTPTGPKTRYQTWTARNQIATRTDENGQIERFFYNPVGKLDHFINANSQTIAFVYDALNRTTTIDYPGSAVDTQFTYDAAGQLIFMDDALGRTTWTYTTLGQIETVTDPFGKSLSYHYDVNGNRDRITYPGFKVALYAFDDANALLSVTDWQTRTISRALTAAGRVATIAYPNGITTTVGHDAAGRENAIQHQKGIAVPFIHFGYTFDPKGQIQEVSPTTHPLPKQAFTAASSTYTYDTANQLASIDGVTVTHDNQGNVLTGKLSPLSTGTDTLTWDIEGRLTAATIAGVTSTSSYDGKGHRLQTTHGSSTTRYVTDTTGSLAQVMAETDGSGTITAYYLYLGGLAARILPNGDLSCYHTDRAGNVLALTDGGGSTTDLYQYDEFGVPAGSSGSSQNPFRYAGGFGVQTDANGTLFARQRIYHPDLGRWLSRDALFGSQQNGQSLNRYAAFLNDPISYSDPSGFVSQHAVSASFYTDSAPLVLSRKGMIAGNYPGTVVLAPNPKATAEAPFYEDGDIGTLFVSIHDRDIDEASKIIGVDADLIRTIMFIETSHGWYDPSIVGVSKLSKSILPMNINADYWGDAFGSRSNLARPSSNVFAGAEMLKRIEKLSPTSGIAGIATLYNNINATAVSNYGARAEAVYSQKPWNTILP